MTCTTPATRTLTFKPNTDDGSTIAGLLTITTDRVSDYYVVTEFPTGFDARGFTLSRPQGGDSYSVFVCGSGKAGDKCDCPAAVYRRKHGPCKHAAALRKLCVMDRI